MISVDINKPSPTTGLEVSVFVPVPLGSAEVSRGCTGSGGDYYYYYYYYYCYCFMVVMTVIRNYKCGSLISKLSRYESSNFFEGATGTPFMRVGCIASFERTILKTTPCTQITQGKQRIVASSHL
jgi:hypothetical protein